MKSGNRLFVLVLVACLLVPLFAASGVTAKADQLSSKPGDVNNDNLINSADALLALKMAVGKIIADETQNNAADLDNNGTVNALDALALLEIAVGDKTTDWFEPAVTVTPYASDPEGIAVAFTPGDVNSIQDNVIAVNIDISADSEIGAMDLVIDYSQDYLQPAAIQDQGEGTTYFTNGVATDAAGALLCVSNGGKPIRLSAAGTRGYRTAGTIVTLYFSALRPLPESADSLFTVTPVYLEHKEDTQQTYSVVAQVEPAAPSPADLAAAQAVEALIDALPSVADITLDDWEAVTAVFHAYSELTDEQKALVTNLDRLNDAETRLMQLNGELERREAAQSVDEMIAALPDMITMEDERAVVDARRSYEQLHDDEKPYVTLLAKLEHAEAAIAALVEESSATPGDLNGDDAVDAKDALLVLKASVGKADLTPEQTAAADLNHDSAVDAKDALMMLKIAVGKA